MAKQAKKVARAVAPAKEYLAELLAQRGKDDPPDFAMLTQALFGAVTARIPTGTLALDKLTGGGWPEGRITEICAWEGVGKSTLMDQAAAQCQRMGGVSILIDSEQARDLRYTASLGVSLDEFILAEADDIEGGFEQLDKILAVQAKKREVAEKKKQEVPPVLVLWDSLGGTPARAEVEGAPDDSHVSPAARAISANFRRIIIPLMRNRVTLVYSNHFYKQIGGFGSLIAYGGKGPRYYPSIRLWLSRTGNLKIGDQVVGHEIEAKLRKTRVGAPKPPVKLGLVHMGGIANSYTLFEWGLKHGIGGDYPAHRWIDAKGSHKYLVVPGHDAISFKRGFLGLGDLLGEQPNLCEQLAAAFLASED